MHVHVYGYDMTVNQNTYTNDSMFVFVNYFANTRELN